MKFRIDKLSLNFVIANILLFFSFSILAVMDDTEQLIHIESDIQSLDTQSNVVTFTGKVVMMQGTIKINANKVTITRPDGKKGKEIIDGYGNPVNIYQMQDKGKLVRGHASHIHYELAKDLMILTGNAYLEQLDSSITGDKIIYLVKEQKIQAYSEKGKRVTTVITPIQSQDKSKGLNSAQNKSH